MPTRCAALEPAVVPKPWGREVWYSGIEARGESRVRSAANAVPLSQYLVAHGRTVPIILLKALQPATGNLYLEVHETKSEVYVVDAVDAGQWPDGGRMLLGANPAKRRALGDGRFRAALRAMAQAAEVGSVELCAVEEFMRPVELRIGDVATIAPRVPHSLLRGVDVIEFQTPVFERKILASSQPVVTQDGWDSADAVAIMDIAQQPTVLAAGNEAVEVVATTPEFTLTRYRLRADSMFAVPPWSVGWVVRGAVSDGERFEPRTAFVAPAATELRIECDAEVLLAVEV